MKMEKYYILVSEGVTDCSFLEAVLEKMLHYLPCRNVKDLPLFFREMIGQYPAVSGELKRQDSPVFYHKDKIGIAVKQANGCDNIPLKVGALAYLIDKLDVYEDFGGFIIFCDTDLKTKDEIKDSFARKWKENDIGFHDECLIIYGHAMPCYIHFFPSDGIGAVEKLLLECTEISYPALYREAQRYADVFMTDEYSKIRKECWASDERIQTFYADKVQLGAVSSVLKPDRPVRFTIKDKIIRSKFGEAYLKRPEFKKLYDFLTNLLV